MPLPDQNQINDVVKSVSQKWRNGGAQLFINGQWQDAKAGKIFASINPANGETLCQVAQGEAADIDLAVHAARRAFNDKSWKMMRPSKRASLLFKLGDLIQKNALELAVMESLDNGKTVGEALNADLPSVWDLFHYYGGWATKIQGETLPVAGPYLNYTRHEPLGVCGQIIPWNFPLLMAAWKLAPALAAGNTVVLKPAEQTPLSVLRLGELAQEAGFPDGIINIVNGMGTEAGAALASHSDVNKVAFTGSTVVGRKIMQAAAESNLKRVSLELGGKSPQIVFADAPMKQAAIGCFYGIFFNKGELCCAGSRVFVEKPVYDEFLGQLKKMAEKMRLGSPQNLETTLGAVNSEEQLKKSLEYIEHGKKSARLVTGGERATDGELAKGFFLKPTIFADVQNDAKIAREEIFGPVLSVMPFDSEEEVLAQANDSPYGLVAGVWTEKLNRAHRMAHALEAGTVWVNCYNCFDSPSPFGGYKESGFGRELGQHALELYTQVKSVWVNMK